MNLKWVNEVRNKMLGLKWAQMSPNKPKQAQMSPNDPKQAQMSP